MNAIIESHNFVESTSLELIANLMSPLKFYKTVNINLNPTQWNEVVYLAKRHKLTAPLYVKICQESILIPNETLSELRVQAFNRSTQMLQLTSELVNLGNLLASENIDYISLKGPVLAKLLYDDFAGKQSGDLDILVEKENVWKASQMLTKNNFVRQYLPEKLSQKQKKYLLQSYHHIGFVHSEKNIYVELHWQLNTNKYAEPYSFSEMWNKAIKVNIGNLDVPCLCFEHALIHQLVHGSGHAWFAMAWLRDTISLSIREEINLYYIWQWALTNGFQRMMAQGLLLGERVFGSFLDPSLRVAMQMSIDEELIDFAYFALTNYAVPRYLVAPEIGRIKQKRYLTKLKADWKYKKQVWSVVSTNPRDWQILRLPENLFFLYIVFRPFFYFYTIYVNKNPASHVSISK